jgi:hypothetical protein
LQTSFSQDKKILKKKKESSEKVEEHHQPNLAQSTTTAGCPINSGNLKQPPNSKQSD